tara:strand:- start:3716 stop:4003 length:288 start_codon:yes stop_codon:yes gene_type:complete
MTEHKDAVIKQAKLLLAEEWAKEVKSIHIFDTTQCTMAYDTHTEDGRVTDTEYMDGRIERTIDGKVIRTFGENALVGDELVSQWERFGPTTDLGL